MSARAIYGLCALVLFFIEVLIALFVTDTFVRGYVGDMLAVVLVYVALRAVTPMSAVVAISVTLVIALVIEFAQLFGFLRAVGLEGHKLARIVLGGVFDPIDLIAYVSGAVLVLVAERWLRRGR